MIVEFHSESTPSQSRVIRRADVGDQLAPAFPASPLIRREVLNDLAICAKRDQLLEQAQNEAQSLVKEAKSEADAIREKAEREAREHVRHECEDLLLRLADANQQLHDSFAESVERVALQIAEAAIDVELQFNRGAITAIIIQLIDTAHRYSQLVVQLHPDDAAAIAPAVDSIRSRAAFADKFDIQVDPRVTPGRIVLQTEMGDYVTSIADRIDNIRSQLASARDKGTAP